METENKEEVLKSIRTGLRLYTPSPKVIKHKKDYTRKDKYKEDYLQYDEDFLNY